MLLRKYRRHLYLFNELNMSYNSFNNAMRERFGGKVYRLSLSTGCTCPNRDGRCGTGGCIFCSEGGSGEFAQSSVLPVNVQIEKAKELVAGKVSSDPAGYIAYFQSFSNTYVHDKAELAGLRELYYSAINHEDILGLSIATRPDCIDDDVLILLKELNSIKPVWVELGLQTSNNKTAELINRGYKTEDYDAAVRKLHSIGIEVVTHVIIGLPGESYDDARDTVKHVVRLFEERKSRKLQDGIKLTLLYVLKGTRLHEMIQNGEIKLQEYTLEEYTDVLIQLLKIIPDGMVVHRITGDPPKSSLISPLWAADKKKVLNYLRKKMI